MHKYILTAKGIRKVVRQLNQSSISSEKGKYTMAVYPPNILDLLLIMNYKRPKTTKLYKMVRRMLEPKWYVPSSAEIK